MEIRHIIVLMIVFTIYVIVGGMVFMILERSEERSKRLEIEISLNSFKERISRLNDQNLTAENFNEIIKILLKARDDNLIDSDGNQHAYINWNFINSFFFAITVITTIGYGHLTPSTIIGMIDHHCGCVLGLKKTVSLFVFEKGKYFASFMPCLEYQSLVF
ncbi:Acid-sensitive two pore domain K+ channel dTASK-6-like protein [Sarcoptes scabiei]|uniref:Acid-sensitive two pore domain K+ channel dTASK-6-like protein n=1 Tax=Sarcoptes scabiei TaxID=52283 RepID=A0A132AK28_SARSC|nr:Acid-sensitive two pore domain K+ channel dTASK-6-like protein [Sarcoptes scabiei]